ncbi:MAG: hypothetical protein ACE5GA_00140 [Candidatus Zixiibacteriota bacterium]
MRPKIEKIPIPGIQEPVNPLLDRVRWEKGMIHPWPFIRYFIKTFDPHDRLAGDKRFPELLMYRVIVEVWMRSRLLLVPKSRQIMISWLFSALYMWEAMRVNNSYVFMTSKDEDDSATLIKRVRFLYTALYNDGYNVLMPEMKRGPEGFGTKLQCEFPDINSQIVGLEQSPDVFRSHVGSGILADEAAFQQYMVDMWTAARRILGDSKFTAVSTPNGREWFYRQVHDIDEFGRTTKEKIVDSRALKDRAIPDIRPDSEEARLFYDMPQTEFEKYPLEQLVAACPGIDYWYNSGNKFHVLQVHHSADPNKSYETERGRIWIAREKEGTEVSDWKREMDIGWDTFSGRPVIDNYSRSTFVREAGLEVDDFTQVRLGIDFGQTGVCFFAQKVFIDRQVQIRILDEIHLEDSDTYELAEKIKDILQTRFLEQWREFNFMAHCDPAGNQRRETTSDKDLNTSIKIIQSYIGKRTTAKKLSIPASTEIVRKQFRVNNGVPGALIDPRCRYLLSCVNTGWHFPFPCDDGKPEKDGLYDHGGDALRHLICNMVTIREQVTERPRHKQMKNRVIRDPITGRRQRIVKVRTHATGFVDTFRTG